MSLKFGLKIETIKSIQDVFLKNKVDPGQIIIYGSRAKGNYRIGSDIDLAIKARHLNLNNLLKIENDLDDLLLPYKIDLSLYHQIENPSLIEHIERVGQILK